MSTVHWRPGFETQLAYGSLSNDFRIQIYDICQPFGPLATLNAHENVVSGLVWKDSETIYSCSKDCTFRIHNLYTDGVNPSELVRNTCMSFSSKGNLVVSMGYGKNSSSSQTLSSLRTPLKRSVFNRWDDKVYLLLLMKKIPIVVNLSKPLQISASIETETFALEAFIDFAQKSITDDSNISGSCAKNAEICSDSGQFQSAQTWWLLSTLFSNFSDKDSTDTLEKSKGLNLMNILLPILNYYAESSNSQMCVTLFSLFHGFSKFKEYCIDRIHVWYDSYLGIYHKIISRRLTIP